MRASKTRMRTALILGLLLLVSACRTHPARPAPPPAATGAAIASAAAALIGTPYAFGGADLGGFDCSGLALYAHERVGLSIPRTAAAQQRAAQPVPLAQLLPGDLVFFRLGRHGIDHVGIYAGAGRFIHAPHRGVAVTSADLADAYYARHLVNAGRFWSAALSSP
jgi:cell wall-associated NlpC family hydrolase